MPPIISLISWFHAVMRLTSRWQPISGFRRWVNSGICVAMPQLQRPVWQERHRWHPRASSAPVAMYTASAPRAMAFTTSALERIPAFESVRFRIADGAPTRPTVDLNSSPGAVFLVHPDPVEIDNAHKVIRELEHELL